MSMKIEQRRLARKIFGMMTTERRYGGVVRWEKRGGFADQMIQRVIGRVEKLGFKKESYTSGGSPDGNVIASHGSWKDKDGNEVRIHSSYGVLPPENRHSITLQFWDASPEDEEDLEDD
jgi:hypothetical protein